MVLDKKNLNMWLLDELDSANASTDRIENIVPWGLDDPEVFGPMKGIREAISEWVLEWCN
jgi:molybdopterin-guanine dinucleotide biosynthesis protein A